MSATPRQHQQAAEPERLVVPVGGYPPCMATYAELLATYLDAPGPSQLRALRRAIRAAPNFDPGLAPSRVIGRLAAPGREAALLDALRGLMPGALLSPSIHAALGAVLEVTGDREAAAREQELAQVALSSIESTGTGSLERPWSTLRVSDQYDLLRSQGRASQEQRLIEHEGKSLDRHICTDGSTAHFDVGAMVGARR